MEYLDLMCSFTARNKFLTFLLYFPMIVLAANVTPLTEDSRNRTFVRQIVHCARNGDSSTSRDSSLFESSPPYFSPLSNTIRYQDPETSALSEVGLVGDPHVRVYFTLTAFNYAEKDIHFFHSAVLLELANNKSHFWMRNGHGQYQAGKYLSLDSHSGIIGVAVGPDRGEISKAMLNLEEKWIAQYDSYDIFVRDIRLNRRILERLCKVVDVTRAKTFGLQISDPSIKRSIFYHGIVMQTRSQHLEPYNSCAIFNIRCLKALGINANPLDLLVNKNIRYVFGMAILKTLAKKERSIEQSMKKDIFDESNFFLNPSVHERITHYKGETSYDYSDERVIEYALKGMRNWTLMMKSLWHAL